MFTAIPEIEFILEIGEIYKVTVTYRTTVHERVWGNKDFLYSKSLVR